MDFDVTVIGAGPTGMNAAIRLSQLGYNVLVVDRSEFPRVKPCGGGLTIKALNWLPHSVGSVIKSTTNELRLGVKTPFKQIDEVFASSAPICAFVVREEFDKFNFDKMMENFVEFEVNSGLVGIDERHDYVRLEFKNKVVKTKYVVGADGANSTVRRLIGAGRFFHRGFAIEGILPLAKISANPVTEFFFGYVKNGYGWIFPKGDHLNVGIYTFDSEVSLSKELLREYSFARLNTDELDDIVGFPLGFGGRNFSPTHNRVLLAGDAAGFAEPLLGEGLHNALKSGRLVADAIHMAETQRADSARKAYRSALSPITSDLARCDDMKNFFYENMDGIGFGALKFPISKVALMKGFSAGKTMHEITNTFFLSPFFAPTTPQSLADFQANVNGAEAA